MEGINIRQNVKFHRNRWTGNLLTLMSKVGNGNLMLIRQLKLNQMRIKRDWYPPYFWFKIVGYILYFGGAAIFLDRWQPIQFGNPTAFAAPVMRVKLLIEMRWMRSVSWIGTTAAVWATSWMRMTVLLLLMLVLILILMQITIAN